MACEEILVRSVCDLAHFILVDSSTVICWTSPFVILGVSGLFCRFYSIFDGKSCFSKQCRPCNVASDLGLHCLLMTLLPVFR